MTNIPASQSPSLSQNCVATASGDATAAWLGGVRILFGAIWVINTVLQANPAYAAHFAAMFAADSAQGQPAWLVAYGHWMLALVQTIGPHKVALATVALDGVLALSLLTGLALPALAWVGAIYNFWLWTTVGGIGGPYTAGATDPGTAIIYALCFVLVAWTRCWEGLSFSRAQKRPLDPRKIAIARIAFGAIWLFDSAWKWTPYFLTHAVTYLQQALPGEPTWIKLYIGFFITVIGGVGATTFAVAAALTETVIGLSLLFGLGLRWIIPVGILYSLAVWTTAEGWGGPYGPGFTANRGDMLGTTNIYAIAFLFLAAWVYFRRAPSLAPPVPAAEDPAQP